MRRINFPITRLATAITLSLFALTGCDYLDQGPSVPKDTDSGVNPTGTPSGPTSKVGQACSNQLPMSCGTSDLFCSYPISAKCGEVTAKGSCQQRPQGCTKEYQPVCGCDNKTYGNACMAAAAGVSIASKGECKKQGEAGAACGGIAGLTCDSKLFCNYPVSAKCGAADALGRCEQRPDVCNNMYAPVCGCNGTTYSNSCYAAAAGISVSYDGKCEPNAGTPGKPGAACGGLTGLRCETELFCNFPISAQCGAADGLGACAKKPEACPDIWTPVCGCDGKTHSNSCYAAMKGVSVVSDGECKPDAGKPGGKVGSACGGLEGLRCEKELFCDFPITAQCGATDALGACSKKPEACPDIWTPVCGCDGKTHSNRCYAATKGVSIAYEGRCEQDLGQAGDACGSRGAAKCAPNLFCKHPISAQCGATDIPGICETKPDVCIEIDQPVCGCDGKTYGNECKAHEAGVSAKSSGACP